MNTCHIVTTNAQTPSLTRSLNPRYRYWEMSDPANLSAVSSGLFSMSAETSTDGKRNPFENRLDIQMEHTITENVIFVKIDRTAPPGFTLMSPWPAILREYFLPLVYPHIGPRENIRPKSVMVREYTERCYEVLGYDIRPRFVIDKYIRVGNNYICSRSYKGRDNTETMTIEMRISEDLKQDIVAGAMHPKRLKKWLENGWEEEWYQYFSR